MRPYDKAHQLLIMARKDLKSALTLAKAEEMDAEAVGFHIQQAAEKALKMWLELLGVIYPKTHDLSLLLGELEDRGEDVERFWSLIELNPFAVEFRYSIYEEADFDWEDVYHQVVQLVDHVESLFLNKEKLDS